MVRIESTKTVREIYKNETIQTLLAINNKNLHFQQAHYKIPTSTPHATACTSLKVATNKKALMFFATTTTKRRLISQMQSQQT